MSDKAVTQGQSTGVQKTARLSNKMQVCEIKLLRKIEGITSIDKNKE